jgi:hypothetical protein
LRHRGCHGHCFMVMQVRGLPQIICSLGVCMFNSTKAMLCSEPTTVTLVGATNLLGGVVEMLISPPFARLRRKLCFQVYLEPMMAAQPCVAPLFEGIIEKLARLFCLVGGDVGGGGATSLGSTVVCVGVWQQHCSGRPYCCGGSRSSHGLPLCCGELRTLGVVSVHLCSMTTQEASPTC